MNIPLALFTLFSLASSYSARSQAPSSAIKQIEFRSMSRGYYEYITTTPDSLKSAVKGLEDETEKVSVRKITSKEWDSLVCSLQKVPLSGMNELKSPSANRSFDGARHSTLTILLDNGESYRHAFDNENPHKKLQPVMKLILALGRKPAN